MRGRRAATALTWAEASRQATQLAEALVELGVEAGDRVAIFMPMCPAVAVASHACAHVGAVQVPIFSGFAAPGDRVAPRGLAGEGRHLRRLVAAPRQADGDARDARRGAASFAVEHVIEWSRETGEWPELVTRQPGTLPPLEVDSEAPYLLAYTSGTTGRPKGALHVQGGFLVSIAREPAYQTDVKAGDRVHFATDMGWIMGPWTVVGGGAAGATIVFAEGAPDWPADRLWRLVESERVTMLGLSPTLVRALIPHGEPDGGPVLAARVLHDRRAVEPGPVPLAVRERRRLARADRERLRRHRGRRVLPHDRASPSRSSRSRSASPRSAWTWTSSTPRAGRVRGEVGELVCRRPWPGMTRGVWGDDERYLETYWRRFPGIWTHGDWASIDEDGYWFLHGRSDDTLNIAGKRIGPAELESAAIGERHRRRGGRGRRPARGEGRGGVDLLRAATRATSRTSARVAAAVVGRARQGVHAGARSCGSRALPKTRSAKIVRRAVRARALGEDPGDLSSLENPESLEEIAACCP